MGADNIEDVLNRSLRELNVNLRLRRSLIRAGYETLADALSASEKELEDVLSFEAFDLYLEMKEALSSNPEYYCVQLTSEKKHQARPDAGRRIAEVRRSHVPTRSIGSKSATLPDLPCIHDLKTLEIDARAAMCLLENHADSAIIAECFPQLTLKIDDVREKTIELFHHYDRSSGTALGLVTTYFPSVFLVFVAYSASQDFDGETFWNNLFEILRVQSDTTRNDFKDAFYRGVCKRGFPCFTKDDSEYYYRNTALLHGGFSEKLWVPLWTDVLIPYARKHLIKRSSSRDVSELLLIVNGQDSNYELSKMYAKRIFEKAPVELMEPLLESAIDVAREVVVTRQAGGSRKVGISLMSSHGLPDAAMRALRSVFERKSERGRDRIVYLPSAELRIVPHRGQVHLHWDAQTFPASFAGRSVSYYVNGEKHGSLDYVMGVGKSILPAQDILLDPGSRYDVRLVLHDSDDKHTQLAEAQQSFDRTRPGSFEFIQSSDGVYRLRRKNERIRQKKTVAFLTKKTLKIVPGKGMTEVEAHSFDGGWNSAVIQIFTVEPGSSGSVINVRTGEVIASWHEDYQVEVDRSHVIGKAADNRDLYSFVIDAEGGNASLPDITIKTLNVNLIRRDLDIVCMRDTARISLPWEIIRDVQSDSQTTSGRLIIRANKAMRIGHFASDCSIKVVQKSTEQVLLNYKFAVVPISEFGIHELYWEDNELHATYMFRAARPITVPSEFGDYEMIENDRYYFDAPLSQETATAEVKSGTLGKSMVMTLYLAGMHVAVSADVLDTNAKRPLCALDVGSIDSRITVSTTGRRRNRHALVLRGSVPLFYRDLTGNLTYGFDFFEDQDALLVGESGDARDVVLTLSFGEVAVGGKLKEATADVRLAECVVGAGLGGCSLSSIKHQTCVCFDHRAAGDFDLKFYCKEREISSCVLKAGWDYVVVSQQVRYLLDIKETIFVTVTPYTLFGEVDDALATTYSIHR